MRSTIPFRFDASLRIGGVGDWHEEITKITGLIPSHSHKKGEPKRGNKSNTWKEDIWIFESELGVAEPIENHLEWLWCTLGPHKEYLNQVISKAAWADVCIGCLSESSYPMFTANPPAMSILKELNVGFTFNFTCV